MNGSGAPLEVAVVGLGVGEQHARGFLEAGCALRWVYDLDRSKAEAVLASLGTGAIAESFEAILGDPSVDVISIATYDDHHAAAVVDALRHRKHVFVEKPLCRSWEELRSIDAALRASGRHLCSNLVLRAAPVYLWLRQAVAAGEFGEVFAFDGDYLYGRLHKMTEGWRKDVPDYSVMQGGGIHLLDLMLWITGQRPERVTAVGSRLVAAGTPYRYDDYAAATFTFPSGLIGRITANFGCVHRHQHVVRLFGTKATFIHDDAGVRIHRLRQDGALGESLEMGTLPASKGALVPAFVRAIVDGASGPEMRQDLDVIAVCLAADCARAGGRAEDIAYV